MKSGAEVRGLAARIAVFLAIAASLACGQEPPALAPAAVPRYSLEVRLQPADHLMQVAGTVELPPSSSSRSLRFSLDAAATKVHFEAAFPAGKDSFTITSRKGDDGDLEWTLQPPPQRGGGRRGRDRVFSSRGFPCDKSRPGSRLQSPALDP